MGLSRLDNFLKSVRGSVIYVDPNSLDSTDSIENQGNSLTRPFKTIQRALIEASRFSYQRGLDNDRFNKTTIVLYPGEHVVDNRPGYIPDGANNFRLRSGATTDDLVPFDLTTNFDLITNNNALYKLNSVYGGVIIPRGTSIVGMDLRKTKIRPKYVPNPENDQIERSAVFRVTGGCYMWQFSILDADPNGLCYKDYTVNTFVPNFSHHKLTCFEYADGVNGVSISDDFQTFSTDRTDLDMYYEKVGIVYGQSSGRPIEPDYPSSSLDIQPVVDEYRIVGSRGAEIGISSIRSGDGVTSDTNITVTLSDILPGLNIDTPIRIQGIGAAGYDGQYVVSQVNSSTEIVYQVQNAPANPLPSTTGSTLNISVDTVTSASPYIFNISMRSVFGMCGLLADGDKADGFKSMVVAQFTGIGLQKDDNAFVKYDSTSGEYKDSTAIDNLHTDSLARFKPEYENFHIKAKNNSFLQLVSIFAIGYAQHFVAESGGDHSITNSNSNFGAKSLVASGFRKDAFSRDDIGYITHIIPPKELQSTETSVEFTAIDVGLTTSVSAGAATTSKLYLYNESNEDVPPSTVIDGYRVGAKQNDKIYAQISQSGTTTEYFARIIMPSVDASSETSFQKEFTVGRSVAGINSITTNVFTLTENHTFISGESVRIYSENGHLPDGLNNNQLYYTITDTVDVGLNANQVKLSQSLNDALRDNPVTINNKGGILKIRSKVSDKSPGEIGHPVQFDSGWYINVSTASSENTLYDAIIGVGTAGLGDATPRTYIKRTPDTRGLIDTIYRIRYVIPKDSSITARPPLDGYILEESGNIIGTGTTEIAKYFSPNSVTLDNSTELRNPRFIANAEWDGTYANITTEIPHNLTIGSDVEIVNITSTNNPTGIANSAFNGTFTVAGISSAKRFSYALANNPGTFANDTSQRTSDLPYFARKKFTGTYQVYRSQEVKKYIPGVQDGVYHLLIVNSSNSPTVTPFSELRFQQPIQNLYPQTNRDQPNSDPNATVCFAVPDPIGQVVVDDPQKSLTKESLQKGLYDFNVGFGLTNVVSNAAGTAHTFYSSIDHGLAGITSVSIVSGGSGYGSVAGVSGNQYNATLVGFAGSTTGSNATALITYNTSGTITAVKIMDGGSAYGIGNSLSIVGVATTTGHSPAVVQVTHINNPVNDSVQLFGVLPTNPEYNSVYKITGVQVGNTKQIEVQSASPIDNPSTGLGSTITAFTQVSNAGKSVGISTISYQTATGITTITTSSNHGLNVNNKILLGGSIDTFFNQSAIVSKINSLTSFDVNLGVTTSTVSTGGSMTVYRYAVSSAGGDVTVDNENIGGRLIYQYAGITTALSNTITSGASDATPLSIPNADTLGLRVGDYLEIDEEVFRIKQTVVGSSVYVFRELFGTSRATHSAGSIVKKINVYPIELRRNSIIRASGHTFEYLGFGPGNYSTALPERQDRILSPTEELIAQNTRIDGGVSIFTAMNSDGDFYTGNKKVNSATGQEEVFDAPIPTVVGEEIDTGNISVGFDVLTPLEASITRSLRVEGGSDNNLVSEFDGPVVFNNKITSNSDKGIEATSLFLQGDAIVSRKITVSATKPTLAGNYGDIVTKTEPGGDDFAGWIYTTENEWKEFGFIGRGGVGISSDGSYFGITTAINVVATGFTFGIDYDVTSGISTLNFDNNPRVAITTGALAQNLVGIVTTLNFVGGIVTVTGGPSGIATVSISPTSVGGTNPGTPFNSLQWNNNNSFDGVSISYYDDAASKLFFGNYSISDPSNTLAITNDGRIGLSSYIPTAKLEVVADNETAVYIKSTSGSGNIIRVDDSSSDTTPLVVDVSGKVGILTDTPGASLDVGGNAYVTGNARIYESDRSNYVQINAPTLGSNYSLTLPTTVGTANSILYTTGSGVLDWTNFTSLSSLDTDDVPEGSTNLYYTAERAQDAVGAAINAGIQTGIEVTYNDTGDAINFNVTASATLYPFSTRGFSIPL